MDIWTWIGDNHEWLLSGIIPAVIFNILGLLFIKKRLNIKILKKNKLKVSNADNIFQTGDNASITVTGISMEKTMVIVKTAFELALPELHKIAKVEIDIMRKEFISQLGQQLTVDESTLDRIKQPSRMNDIMSASKSYVLNDTAEARETIIHVLKERLNNDKNDLESIVYSEVLVILGKLTRNELKIITTIFIHDFIAYPVINSMEQYFRVIQLIHLNFIDFTQSLASSRHILSLGCGSTDVIYGGTYYYNPIPPGIDGNDKKKIEAIIMSSPVGETLFEQFEKIQGSHEFLTPTGMIIGTHYFEVVTGISLDNSQLLGAAYAGKAVLREIP